MAYHVPGHPPKIMNLDVFDIRPATTDDVQTIVDFNAAMALETEQRILDRDRLREGAHAVLTNHQYGFYIMAEIQDKTRSANL
jgi:hypothetical protein